MAIASVIVPAHDEAAVIEASLRSLLDDPRRDELEVIVVCNGCADDTAERARGVSPAIRVLETDIPSKAVALNLGDSQATAFPRLYVDADVVVSPGCVSRVAASLSSGPHLVAAPRIDLRPAPGTSWAMRRYLAVWGLAPYFGAGMVGSGFYGLSEAGRARFASFPTDVGADDMLVQRLFRPEERATVADAWFRPAWPRSLPSLVRVKRRHHALRQQLESASIEGRVPPLLSPDTGGRGWLAGAARDPRHWFGLGLFTAVGLLAEHGPGRDAATRGWARDTSSRSL